VRESLLRSLAENKGVAALNNIKHFLSPVQSDPQEEEGRAVGSPEYLAPEILLGYAFLRVCVPPLRAAVLTTSRSTGCNHMVDWWALGIIIYEFLFGITPFYGETVDEIFANICSGNGVPWPDEPDQVPL
jgi:serine/threonine protein kinase